MALAQAIQGAALVAPEQFDRFRQHIDPVWVEEAVVATGFASVRRRRLPADQVIWLVVGMALMRNESIQRVASLLNVALPARSGATGVASSALTQARQRLGDEPMEYLFHTTASAWAHRSARAHPWRQLAVYALDGTTVRVPDSPDNWGEFGGSEGNGTRAGSAYPTVRAVALMAARSHLVAAVRFGAYSTGEVTLAAELWSQLPEDSLAIVDRNFTAVRDLVEIATGAPRRHWLVRARANMKPVRVEKLGQNDELVELPTSRGMRARSPKSLPEAVRMRAIRYQRPGFRPGVLLTSLLDAKKYPAQEIVRLYHERWEIELGYDEIKTHLLDRQEAIRSRTPQGVRQEVWGILLAYNLVRVEMERAASEAGVEPTRISFVNALSLIRNAWLVWSTPPLAPGRIPEHLLDLHRHLGLLLLPERRSERRYPRVVKIKMSNYDKKWVKRPRPN
ncbi:IS4 family transposase [Myxococcus stipitatus]|uniref:IS4 family transposase n=1 Tax=Myxococcus stipitatus TaxID=83455 RepID=UPI001F245755|nr:IS4 family transposase [Myxococcus stipitatus]MCE9674127.1 IS4 family transposase [Myxococcus stipitatus]